MTEVEVKKTKKKNSERVYGIDDDDDSGIIRIPDGPIQAAFCIPP